MICPYCGYDADDNFKFCPDCGGKLQAPERISGEEIAEEIAADSETEIAEETAADSETEIAEETAANSETEIAEETAADSETEIAEETAANSETEIAEPEPAAEPEPTAESEHTVETAGKKKPLNAAFVSFCVIVTLTVLAFSFMLYFGYIGSGAAEPVFSGPVYERGGQGAPPEQASVVIENIYLPEKEMLLFEGQTKRVKLDIYPGNASEEDISWFAVGEGVSVSEDGRVTGLTAGGEGVVTALAGNAAAELSVRVLTRDEAFFEAIEQITNWEQNEKIDFGERNFTPSPINPQLTLLEESEARRKWGANLFARVNDELQSYRMEQKRLVNAATGNFISCDVYREKDSGDVRKIVAVESFPDYVKATDYYFINGRLGFIFEKIEPDYSPLPANWGTAGTRLYFEGEAMTTWRDVSRADERLERDAAFIKTDYSIARNGIEWSRTEYTFDSQTGVVKNLKESMPSLEAGEAEKSAALEEYKAMEAQALNAAYNIYAKIAEMPETFRFSGFVSTEDALPFKGAAVKAFSEQYGMLVGQTVTDGDGIFSITVPRTELPYTVSVSAPGYLASDIYNINTNEGSGKYLPPVQMLPETSQSAVVLLSLINAETGEPSDAFAAGAVLRLRRGLNNTDGESAYSIALPAYNKDDEAEEESLVVSGYVQARCIPSAGAYEITLPPGSYTAELTAEGYESAFFPVHAAGGESKTQRVALVSEIYGGEIKIVLEWGSFPEDLDSHLLQPSGEDITHGFDAPNAAVSPDATQGGGPETIVLNRLERGTNNYYVVDYANIQSGNYALKQLSGSLAAVSVYTHDGLAAQFYVPRNAEGVIWHVFNLTGGEIVSVEKCYNMVSDFERLRAEKPAPGELGEP